MSRVARFMCGVPDAECTGGILHTDQIFSTKKCHSSRAEAMRCMQHYLEKTGFKKLSSREFQNPDNGPIRILPKRTKFGARLRQGKGEQGSRFEPERGSGVII